MSTEPESNHENPTDANITDTDPVEVHINNPSVRAADFWVETLKTIGVSVVLALAMRQFVAEARFIPSGSMEPTLLVDDRLIVDKVTYRFSDPQRGDIVVFDPTDTLKAQKYTEAFIKRVIGLPGDKVEVQDDKVTINGKPLTENYPSTQHPEQMVKIYTDKNKQDPSVPLWTAENKGPDFPQPGQSNVVPAGQYLVLGDHRSNSLDGRVWGYVPKDRIVGKALVRFWPLNRLGGIDPKPKYSK
jgi:signal peptidase I